MNKSESQTGEEENVRWTFGAEETAYTQVRRLECVPKLQRAWND